MDVQDIVDEYARVLSAARRYGKARGRQALLRINSALNTALNNVSRELDRPLTPREMSELRSQLVHLIDDFARTVVGQVDRSVTRTVRDTVDRHKAVITKLTDAKRDLTRIVQRYGDSDTITKRITLLMRVHALEAVRAIDKLQRRAAQRGVTGAKLTKDIRQILRGNFPDLSAYGLRRADLAGLRTLASDGRRIVVSETNEAMRASGIAALKASPAKLAAQWTLSPSHKIADECDGLARANSAGLGRGYYLLVDWPGAPHPYCGCGPGAVKVVSL